MKRLFCLSLAMVISVSGCRDEIPPKAEVTVSTPRGGVARFAGSLLGEPLIAAQEFCDARGMNAVPLGFFQVGKDDFRREYWQASEQGIEQGQGNKIERVAFWAQNSFDKWNEALSDSTGESFRRALNPSVTRISLLNQSANVIEQTPSVVPYQYGWLYCYMAITWIPRFVWPDKP